MSAETRSWVRRLHSLPEGEIRRRAAARELGRRRPEEALELVGGLLALSRQGVEGAACALAAVVSALSAEASGMPDTAELRRLAQLGGAEPVAALFQEGPPRQTMDHAMEHPQTLGFLKTQARTTRNPDQLARLATVSNPAIIRNLLRNPRLTEELVVRIAARRPARAEPLEEIWRSERWSSRRAVRRALVFNPYLPVEVGSKIVPLLTRVDLRELAQESSVHPSLREQARLLLGSP